MRSTFSVIGAAVLVLSIGGAAVMAADEAAAAKNATTASLDWATPVLNAAMCPLTKDPWNCGRQQAARMINVFLADVELTKQEIKDEADADLADRIAHRAFSESDLPEKEKPSAVMTTLDNYVTNSILSFMGRNSHSQQEHMKKKRKPNHHQQQQQQQQQHHPATTSDQHHPDHHHEEPQQHHNTGHHEHHVQETDDDDDDDDDAEDEDDEPQQFQAHHNIGPAHGAGVGHRKPHGHGIGHRKPIHHKYGRDLGVTRGKKHKKKFKKAIVKLLILAAVAKVKLEFFLKVLATHLQIKFFIIALLGLLLNAAKFWLDLKKGHNPQKVIYYEHAQHQHHYDDHGDEGWGGGGGYWKRSLDEDTIGDTDDATYEERVAQQQQQAYRQSRGVPTVAQTAQQLAYSRQKPANAA